MHWNILRADERKNPVATEVVSDQFDIRICIRLLRTIGFAAAPGLFRVLGIVPGLGPLVQLAVWIWLIMSTVVAVRQAFDFHSTGRALAVCLIGSLVGFVARLVLAVTSGGMSFLAARSVFF